MHDGGQLWVARVVAERLQAEADGVELLGQAGAVPDRGVVKGPARHPDQVPSIIFGLPNHTRGAHK